MLQYLLFLLIGAVAGLASGCLGIGGGMIIVPGLAFTLGLIGFSQNEVMHMAVGNSLCIMIVLSATTSVFNWRAGYVVRKIFDDLLPLAITGTFVGVVLARVMNGRVLSVLFALFLLLMAVHILRPQVKPEKCINEKLHQNFLTQFLFRLSGLAMGLLGGLFGVGGSVVAVPFFLSQGFTARQSTGTSSALIPPVALTGAFLFMLMGMHDQVELIHSVGYLYWPALLCVTPASLVFSYLGHRLGKKLSYKCLSMIFSLLLFFLSVKMFWTVFHV